MVKYEKNHGSFECHEGTMHITCGCSPVSISLSLIHTSLRSDMRDYEAVAWEFSNETYSIRILSHRRLGSSTTPHSDMGSKFQEREKRGVLLLLIGNNLRS